MSSIGQNLLTSIRTDLYVTKTVTGVIASNERFVRADSAAGTMTLTLPPADQWANEVITVKKVGGGSNAVTVAAHASNVAITAGINATTGLATYETDGERGAFYSDGEQIYTLASHVA